MTWLIVTCNIVLLKNVIPIEKLVPVCAEQLNQLFNLFFKAKLCDKAENWTAVVQHWLLWNADWQFYVSIVQSQVSVFSMPTDTSRLVNGARWRDGFEISL